MDYLAPEAVEELASLYVLGLLPRREQRLFECILGSGDQQGAAALRALSHAAASLAFAEPAPVPPPPDLKARLMQRIAAEGPPGLGAVRKDEGVWKPASSSPGVSYKKLYVDRAAGLVTTLVRMEPGAVINAHVHTKPEQCLVLEGDLIHEDHVYGPGDFTWADANSLDPEISTRTGNLLLIIGAP